MNTLAPVTPAQVFAATWLVTPAILMWDVGYTAYGEERRALAHGVSPVDAVCYVIADLSLHDQEAYPAFWVPAQHGWEEQTFLRPLA